MNRIGVVQFQRRALPGVFSIERFFEAVRGALPADIEVRLETNRFHSRGVVPRLLDALRARRRRGTVNHVLGDVHYLSWFLPRRGSILTVHDCVSLERLSGVRRSLLWLGWYWLPIEQAEYVTVISEYTRQELARWVPGAAAKVRVIPPPLSPGFTPSPAPRRGDRLRLLQVGTAENKNLPRVIEACRDLPVTLVIVGKLDASVAGRLQALRVPYENHVALDDAALVQVYRDSDALIFASTYEGFGLPIIEAQAVGRPVVTSRICSMPEASGGAAHLVDPYDIADIRRGVQRLIADRDYCDELVRRGHDNVARYAPERIAEAFAALYRSAREGASGEPARAGAPRQLGPHAEGRCQHASAH